jgi:hypothetical protein
MGDTKQPRLRVIHIPSLFKGKILDLRKATEYVAVLTEDNCQGVFLVIAMVVEGVRSEAISSPSVEQIKLKMLSPKTFQEELNILKISDEVTGTTFDLDVLSEKQIFDAVTSFGKSINELEGIPLKIDEFFGRDDLIILEEGFERLDLLIDFGSFRLVVLSDNFVLRIKHFEELVA